jgi:hypothetical protein
MPHCTHVRLPRQRMRRCSRVGAEGVAGREAVRADVATWRGSAQGTGAVAPAAHDLEGRRRSSVVRLRADHVAYRRAHTQAPCPRPAPCAAAGAASACWRRRSAAPCPPARAAAAARRRGAPASNTAPPPPRPRLAGGGGGRASSPRAPRWAATASSPSRLSPSRPCAHDPAHAHTLHPSIHSHHPRLRHNGG